MLKNSVPDKLTQSHIESAIFALIKTDLVNLIKTKASLSKSFHIQPSEVDKMPMWEFEIFIQHLNGLIEDENEEQKQEMDKYQVNKYQKMADPNNMSKMMPKMQPMQMPKF